MVGVLGIGIGVVTAVFSMAVGARPDQIVARFRARAGLLVGTGAAVGVVFASLASPLLTHQLYGVTGPGVVDLLLSALLVTAIALAPTPVLRRAGRTDPASVLRTE